MKSKRANTPFFPPTEPKIKMPIFRQSSKISRSLSRYHSPSRFLSHQNPYPNSSLACRLNTRAVIRFRGPDTAKFLQGLLTNDVRKLTGGDGTPSRTSYLSTPNVPFETPPPIYSALLTPQGRFLYDLFLYRAPSSEPKLDRTGSGPGSDMEEELTVLADVDSVEVEEILGCFKKYRLRSKVEIDNVAEEFCCWQRFGCNLSFGDPANQEPEAGAVGWGASVDCAGASAAHGDELGWQWFKDPRLDCLGFRGIFPSNKTPPLVESDKEGNEEHYLLWRIERGVAEGSTEIPKGEAIPLEYNLVGLNAISFEKGCYVGQELVARTHHRGVIRKRLLPVKFTDDSGRDVKQEVAPGSEVVDCTSNKKVGMVRTALGSSGMGVLKLEDVFKQSALLGIKDKLDVKVKAIRPDWWPSEWTQFNEQQKAAT